MYAVTQLFDKEGRYGNHFFYRNSLYYFNSDCSDRCTAKKDSEYTLGALCVAAIFSAVVYPEMTWKDRIVGSVSVSAILLAVTWIRRGAFGAGDVKLMAVSGLLLGTGKNLTAFLFAVVMATVYCLPGVIWGDRKSTSEIAFGPFLCMGIVLSIFFGEKFIQWYMS